ncbi:hypothetical protein C1I97_07515 [Streptomyces sp. NTH33]|uniref:hypothetical protein n=1 Tax=Streptomyces sp. NTH33 TaxID=1735453 RepID=UPI000DA80D25|nr:hypothetical protein [Streptomyces sp. NTH33]PZH15843.1 hypothetical protein C1I97_07515 [Streptomyces sp. NTH33]
MRGGLVGATAVLAVTATLAGIKLRGPQEKTADPDAMCWGALSRAQAKPLLSTERPVTATETAPDEREATCDVRTGDKDQDIQFVLSLQDGALDNVTPPEGVKRLTGSRAGWVTQARGQIRLSDSCAYALNRTTASRVDLVLATTIQVRKHYHWKSEVLVPRISQVLTEAAEKIERKYKCASE